jgi:tetratricopeptide (TPR) repeat protein
MQACGCASGKIHAGCLAELLEHDRSKRCAVCLQLYDTAALFAAARFNLSKPTVFGSLMTFCGAATDAGRTNETLAILSMVPSGSLRDVDLAQFLYERGRVLRRLGRTSSAECNFKHALVLIQKNPQCSIKPLVMTLTALAQTHIELKHFGRAAQCLEEVVVLTPRLSGYLAEASMRVVAQYCLARGDLQRHAQALKTIYEIVRLECPSLAGRAAAFLEMRLAEVACGIASDLELDPLRQFLRTLRRSHSKPQLVEAASKLLGPTRRLHTKTHSEDA